MIFLSDKYKQDKRIAFSEACRFMADNNFDFKSEHIARLLGYRTFAFDSEIWMKLSDVVKGEGASIDGSEFMEKVCDIVDPYSALSPEYVINRIKELVEQDAERGAEDDAD